MAENLIAGFMTPEAKAELREAKTILAELNSNPKFLRIKSMELAIQYHMGNKDPMGLIPATNEELNDRAESIFEYLTKN